MLEVFGLELTDLFHYVAFMCAKCIGIPIDSIKHETRQDSMNRFLNYCHCVPVM